MKKDRDRRAIEEDTSLSETIRRNLASELYSDLLGGCNPLYNPKLYSNLVGLPSDARGLMLARYKKIEFQTPEDLGASAEACFFHPGVASRDIEFLKFIESHPDIKDKTPLEIIETFSATLGFVRLYRGMALTEGDLENIKQSQILSPGMRNPALAENIIFDMLAPTQTASRFTSKRPNSFMRDCMGRLSDCLPHTSLITLSTSIYAKVASSVGWHDSGRTLEAGLLPCLFSLSVPRIMTYDEKGILGDTRGPRAVKIDGEIFTGEGLELFVPFAIPKSWINEVSILDIPNYWERCSTKGGTRRA